MARNIEAVGVDFDVHRPCEFIFRSFPLISQNLFEQPLLVVALNGLNKTQTRIEQN